MDDVTAPAATGAAAALVERAPAKINLTLAILGRRADGYHELDSLVVFADLADRLRLTPDDTLRLTVSGPNADQCGEEGDNLVLKAARALAGLCGGLQLGHFALTKELPVAAGIGGGSSDAAAALRLLARANGMAPDDPRLFAAARATGADVPVCLDPRPRIMRGIGEILSGALKLPPLPAVLVNPGVGVATKDVFAALRLAPGQPLGKGEPGFTAPKTRVLASLEAVWSALAEGRNDLERPAVVVQPVIADVLAALRALPQCRLARMSGSGATCFALFETAAAAAAGARALQAARPQWWVRATTLGAAS